VTIGDQFPIRSPTDEDGFENALETDVDRFECARNGDNLMIPFQCDLCHFRNTQKRNPDAMKCAKDALASACIRRANLDGLWSREPSTVSRNASQARTMEELGEALGFESVGPPMGPFPLKDTFRNEDGLRHTDEITGTRKVGANCSVCCRQENAKCVF
jgi:hypothetical protein